MPEEPAFKISEQMYKTLVEWQEKIDSGEIMTPETEQELVQQAQREEQSQKKPDSRDRSQPDARDGEQQ